MEIPRYLSRKASCPSCVKSSTRDIGNSSGIMVLQREWWLVCRTCERKYPILNAIPFLTIEEGDRWIQTPVADLPVPPTSALGDGDSEQMRQQTQRSVFIGEYGPADWLCLKEEILDSKAQELEQILPAIAERAKGSEEELEILDVASGEGRFTAQLHSASKSTKIVALDNYAQYLKTARERYSHLGQIHCVGNLYDLPFGDETFDIVATRSTLDIMDGPRMFREMVRVLKPGGWIYVSLVYDSTYKFAPGPDADLEFRIQRAYDRYAIEWGVSYDIGAVNGSRGGRFLPLYAWDHGLTIIKLVAADWFLYPNPEFSAKEKAVLHLQLEMIYGACKRAQESDFAIKAGELDEWRLRISDEIDSSRTTYTSRQFSILAEKPLA